MIQRRQLIAGAGALAGAAALPHAARAEIKGEFAAFRFAMRGLSPVTAMTIGKSKPYLVLIDSGNTGGAMLKPSIVKALDLDHVGTGRVYGATGTDTVEGYAAHQVVFGGTLLQQDMEFGASEPGHGLDGIIPLGVLTAAYTEMDFTQKLVRIATKGQPDTTGFRPLRCERVTDGGPFVADCEVDGIKARLLVDTGAEITLSLTPNFVRAHGLWDSHPKFLPSFYRGVTGAIGSGRTVKLKSLKIAGIRFEDPVGDLADPRINTLGGDIDGILGIELLRRFTLGFDARASTVWLKPNNDIAEIFTYDRSGLVETFKDGVGVVVSAQPGSPAEEAGLRPGDKLIALTTPAQYYAFDYSLSGAPDEVRAFEIERGGQRIPIKMTLKDWL